MNQYCVLPSEFFFIEFKAILTSGPSGRISLKGKPSFFLLQIKWHFKGQLGQ